MSEAFSRVTDFELSTELFHDTKDNVLTGYGVTHTFAIREFGEVLKYFWPRSLYAAIKIRKQIARDSSDTVYYTRDVLLAFFLSIFSTQFCKSFYFELHSLGKVPAFIYKYIFSRARGIISTNRGKKNVLVSQYGIAPNRIFVAPNGFDAVLFSDLPDRQTARTRVGLPSDKKIVMYVGSTQAWKGADIVKELAREMSDINFVIVGADKDERHGNMIFVSKKPYREIPMYLRATDILIAPYPGGEVRSEKYFSPIKLFDYMASGTPIIVSDLPSIREVLNEELGLLVKNISREGFETAISWAFDNYMDMESRARRAQESSKKFSWDARAQAIVNFIKLQRR